jgi:hypothetical protein
VSSEPNGDREPTLRNWTRHIPDNRLESEFVNPSPGHPTTFEKIQFRLDDWLQAQRELKEERGLGAKTKEKVDSP